MEWYYVSDGGRTGPVDEDALAGLVADGDVTADTLVWCEGMPDWVPYADAAVAPETGGAAVAVAAEPVAQRPAHRVCVECGESFPEDAGLAFAGRHVCAICKPIFFARVAEGTLYSSQVRYAGFWVRFVAKLIDTSVVGLFNTICFQIILTSLFPPGTALYFILQVLSALLSFTVFIAYTTWFVGRFGATPGKMIFGLEIIRPDGGQISYPRAFGRFFAEIVSGIALNIGYIMVGFDEEKRSLHDRICDTRVIRTA